MANLNEEIKNNSNNNFKLVLHLKQKNKFSINFGNELKKIYFNLDTDVTFLNHGSYGTVPKHILTKRYELQQIQENNPDDWFRYSSRSLYDKNRIYLANYLNLNVSNLILCFNATDSINSILKSIQFNGKKDAILYTNLTYGAIQNTIDYISKYRLDEQNSMQKIQLNIKFPIMSSSELIKKFDDICHDIIVVKQLKLKLFVLDQISSGIPLKYPVKEICKVVRKWSVDSSSNTTILIDGAHGIGHLDLNINELDCDYYISNLHKWFMSPRGCTFVYFKDKLKAEKSLEPNYISSGYGNKPDIYYNFFYRGIMDQTSWYCIEDCVNFYNLILGGYGRVYDYNINLIEKAIDMLVNSWQTKRFDLPKDLEAPFMRLVKLPVLKDYTFKDGAKLMRDIFFNYKIISVFVNVQNELYCRLSCFVYNDMNDFIRLEKAILNLKA